MADCTTWEEVSKLFTQDEINCMKRHGVQLDNCANVSLNADEINRRVNLPPDDGQRMPQAPTDPWTQEEKDCFQSWIDAGKPCPS